MKRKFLEDMGLTKEQVDIIMAENGNDIEAAKGEMEQAKAELEQLRTQLQEANTTIDGFKDYDQVKSQVDEYKTKYETSKAEYEAKISDMQFGTSLEAAITAAGGRNAKAIKALLDVDTLKSSKDQTARRITAIFLALRNPLTIRWHPRAVQEQAGLIPTRQRFGQPWGFRQKRKNKREVRDYAKQYCISKELYSTPG